MLQVQEIINKMGQTHKHCFSFHCLIRDRYRLLLQSAMFLSSIHQNVEKEERERERSRFGFGLWLWGLEQAEPDEINFRHWKLTGREVSTQKQ